MTRGGISPSLTTMQGGNRQPKILTVGKINSSQDGVVVSTEGISPTHTSGHGNTPKTIVGYRIRKLTPLETWRLQGFKDADFEKAEKVNSNSQLYKQAGNSISVNVLMEIYKILFKEYIKEE